MANNTGIKYGGRHKGTNYKAKRGFNRPIRG